MQDKVDDRELTIGKGKISIKGTAYDDLRPIFLHGGAAVGQVIQLINNLLGVPLDWANHNLEQLRTRYVEKINKIPADQRQLPSLRIGSSVVRNAALSADEPEMQELFAELLAASSDSDRAGDVHVAFATIIQELEPAEALVIRTLHEAPREAISLYYLAEFFGDERTDRLKNTKASISNLQRLGLVAWAEDPLQSHLGSLDRLRLPRSWDRSDNAGQAVEDLRDAVRAAMSEAPERRSIEFTPFGRKFAVACIGKFENERNDG